MPRLAERRAQRSCHGRATAAGTIRITVEPAPNRSPDAQDDDYELTIGHNESGGTVDWGWLRDQFVLDNDTDPDAGQTLSVSRWDAPTYGEWLAAGESRSYTHEASDGHGGTDAATIRVRVVRPNQSPTAHDDVHEVQFGRDESGRFVDLGSYPPSTENDEDPDGDWLSITGNDAPIGQSWLSAGAELFYRYFLSDGHGGTAEGRVVIRGWPAPNEDPVAQDDEYAVLPYGTTNNLGSVKDNDRDPEGDPLSVRAGTISTTGGGSVSMSADGTFSYTANPGELTRQFSDSSLRANNG